jgi:hypothetical protein
MSQEPDRLLESDRLEEVLEEEGPPQPVLVVQYRTRTVPWLLIVALAITLGLGSLFLYHRREVERLGAQALEARRELQRLAAKSQAEEPRAADPPVKAAMEPRPSDATDAQPIAISSGAAPSAVTQAPAPPGATLTPDPVQTPEPAKADPAMARTQLPLKTGPVSATDPAAPAGPTVSAPPSTAQPPDPAAPVATAAQVTDSTSPFEELSGTDGGSRAGVPTVATTAAPAPAPAATTAAPAPAPAVVASAPAPATARPEEKAVPAGPVAVAAEPPLPSKEEADRQNREEAARKQAEDDHRLAQQQQDLHAIKEDERSKFRDELRMLLEVHGNRAGKEIEALSSRAGRDDDPARKARALHVLGMSGTSQKTKVRQLRAIGMPESVILDYIANQLDKTLGTRNGPRSRDEIWVLAARRLLTYEVNPTPPRPADRRRAPEDPRRQSAKPPAAGPAPARGTPRTP